jgi:copper(I)-binding protein
MATVKAAFIVIAAFLLAACNAEPAPMVTVSEARVVALPSSAAAYFTLINSGGRDRLKSVSADGVGRASLHETSFDGSIMRMRAIDGGFEVPARGQVRLSANGRHVMIQDLARPLAAGTKVRLTLDFERQGIVVVAAPVSGPR